MESSVGSSRLVVVVLLVSVVLGGAVGVVAQEESPAWAAETGASLEQIIDAHNAAVDGVNLGTTASLVRDQRVTLTVTAVDGSVAQYSFRTDGAAHVVDFQAGPHDDPTVRMFTDPATVERVANAPDRAAAFEAAVRAGDVRIEGVGLLNSVLMALVGLALWALASPLQAAAVGAVVLLGAGALVLAGTKVVGGGAVIAGSAGTAGTGSAGTAGAGTAGTSGASTGTVGTAGAGTTGTTGVTTASSTASGAPVSTTGSSAVGTAADPTAGALAQAGGNTMSAGGSLDPVGLADQGLSFFERALFIVAIAKKLLRRVRRSVGVAVAVVLGWFGFARLADNEDDSAAETVDASERPVIRRRGVARRRRR